MPYNPKESEDKIYQRWENSGFFNPDECLKQGITKSSAPVFSIVLPPPNVTGQLHVGHSAMLAIEDIMIRYHRLRGERTLWVPGTDHAAIATQSKVEKILSKESKQTRHDLGREEFLKRVEAYAKQSHDNIVNQCKKLGASLDWSREAYTLDEKRNLAVRTAFKKMYNAGLIYRGDRIINWDPKGQTTVSDDEVVHEEVPGKLYTFKYSPDFPIAIATTRPETKVGDVAVAVHPDDSRYQKYIGQTFSPIFAGVPLQIKIVADVAVDPAFGTGAVGVTPAHSGIDWEIAKRHGLPHPQVISELAKMQNTSLELDGKKILEAREIILTWLKENKLLEKEEEIKINVAKAERSGGIIEPLPKLQWFVAVNKQVDGQSLKDRMLKVVESGQIKIIPDRFVKIYFNWIENLHDWCISRQIWYGHRIPVWYRSTGAHGELEVYCDINPPTGDGWEQDPDTLDTWFSSGLWTFSALGWPTETEDLKIYHPTSVLETGYDILFFWIARMILMTTYLLKTIPFHTVYLHGLVRTESGAKMSKLLDNAIDPLVMVEKYGADALRLALVIGSSPGSDLKLSEDKIRGYKNFANKLWNINVFITQSGPENQATDLSELDEKLWSGWQEVLKEVTRDLDNYRFYLAGEKLYHYAWHTFADKIIEASKPATPVRRALLYKIWREILISLHPFMPFVTEEIWSSFNNNLLMIQSWPRV